MIQKKAQDAGGSHSIQNSEDFTDSQTDIENSDNLENAQLMMYMRVKTVSF